MSAKVLANLMGWEKTFKDVAIPDLPTINAQTEQQRAIQGNLDATPQATQLAGQINKFNFDELQKMYQASVPGFDEMMKTGGEQVNSFLKGELPADVQRTIQRSRGARSFAGGYGGSAMAGGAEAESLGLTSLDLIREGLSASERWLQSAASRLPHMADATSMFISPAQQIAVSTSERNSRFNYDFLKAKQAAMPTGAERALTGLTDWVEGILASAATMGISSAMGGNVSAGGPGGTGGGAGAGGAGGGGDNYGPGFAQGSYDAYLQGTQNEFWNAARLDRMTR
jgi:hypothetical protein